MKGFESLAVDSPVKRKCIQREKKLATWRKSLLKSLLSVCRSCDSIYTVSAGWLPCQEGSSGDVLQAFIIWNAGLISRRMPPVAPPISNRHHHAISFEDGGPSDPAQNGHLLAHFANNHLTDWVIQSFHQIPEFLSSERRVDQILSIYVT